MIPIHNVLINPLNTPEISEGLKTTSNQTLTTQSATVQKSFREEIRNSLNFAQQEVASNKKLKEIVNKVYCSIISNLSVRKSPN